MPHYIGIAEQINEIKYFLVFFSLPQCHRCSDVCKAGIVQGGVQVESPFIPEIGRQPVSSMERRLALARVRFLGRRHWSGLLQSHRTKTNPAPSKGQVLSFLSPGPAVSTGPPGQGWRSQTRGPVPSQVVLSRNATLPTKNVRHRGGPGQWVRAVRSPGPFSGLEAEEEAVRRGSGSTTNLEAEGPRIAKGGCTALGFGKEAHLFLRRGSGKPTHLPTKS